MRWLLLSASWSLSAACDKATNCSDSACRVADGDSNSGPGDGGDGGDGSGGDGGDGDGGDGDGGDGGGDGGDSGDTDDSGDAPPITYSDPILPLGESLVAADGDTPYKYEVVEAVVIGDGQALLFGEGGWVRLDVATGSAEHLEDLTGLRLQGLRASLDESTSRVWVVTSGRTVYSVDASDPRAPRTDDALDVGFERLEDVAADGGRVLIAAGVSGAALYRAEGSALESQQAIAADEATAAALWGDRALIADGEALVLLDVSGAPAALDRLELGATIRALDVQGDQVAASLGAAGAALLSVAGDALAETHRFDALPGGSFSVSLDDDWLWIGSWEEVALAWLGDGGPAVVGTEPTSQWAIGVASEGGRAAVAGWSVVAGMEAVEGAGGPEILAQEIARLPAEGGGGVALFQNLGAAPLELSWSAVEGAWRVAPGSLTVAPGDAEVVPFEADAGAEDGALSWVSDDPDEPAGEVLLTQATNGVGEPHPPFKVQGFTWPDAALSSYSLSDADGPLLLVYFASW